MVLLLEKSLLMTMPLLPHPLDGVLDPQPHASDVAPIIVDLIFNQIQQTTGIAHVARIGRGWQIERQHDSAG